MPLLLLDLDNTLVDRASAVRRWAQGFVADVGAGPQDVEWLVERDGDGLTRREILARAIAERFGLDHAAEEAVLEELHLGLVEHMVLEPAVAAGLEEARDAGWVPVVVTNGTERQQERKIRLLGLDHLVSGWVVSEAVGVRKPDPRIFRLAAERVGLELVGGWMVGDHPVADIAGGQAAGLATCWLRRGRTWAQDGHEPTAQVDDCPAALAHVIRSEPRPGRRAWSPSSAG